MQQFPASRLDGWLDGTKKIITSTLFKSFIPSVTFLMHQLFSLQVLTNSSSWKKLPLLLWGDLFVVNVCRSLHYYSHITKHLFKSCMMQSFWFDTFMKRQSQGRCRYCGDPRSSSPCWSYKLACPPNYADVRLEMSSQSSHVLLAAPKCLSTVMNLEGRQINTLQTPPQSKQPL